VSRTFFPALGVNEDDVCVSAHGKLAPFWAARLGWRMLSARQLSARGGRLDVEDCGRVSAVLRDGVRDLALDLTHGVVAAR
jgi:predicted PhzF superfamily epimerase YddE/YHI9